VEYAKVAGCVPVLRPLIPVSVPHYTGPRRQIWEIEILSAIANADSTIKEALAGTSVRLVWITQGSRLQQEPAPHMICKYFSSLRLSGYDSLIFNPERRKGVVNKPPG
jgi:hypothetical protein